MRVRRWTDLLTVRSLRQPHSVGLWNRDGQIVLVAPTRRGLAVFDVTDIGTRLSQLGSIHLPDIKIRSYGGVWWLGLQAPYAYAAALGNGMYIIDLSDPTAPRLAKHLTERELGGIQFGSMAAVGNLLVMSSTFGSDFATMDISDPGEPGADRPVFRRAEL